MNPAPPFLHRLLCFFGLHDWHSESRNPYGTTMSWRCASCRKAKYGDWAVKQ